MVFIIRVSFVINGLVNMKKIETENIGTRQSLKNIKILDVGCGGGVLTEVLFKIYFSDKCFYLIGIFVLGISTS